MKRSRQKCLGFEQEPNDTKIVSNFSLIVDHMPACIAGRFQNENLSARPEEDDPVWDVVNL